MTEHPHANGSTVVEVDVAKLRRELAKTEDAEIDLRAQLRSTMERAANLRATLDAALDEARRRASGDDKRGRR